MSRKRNTLIKCLSAEKEPVKFCWFCLQLSWSSCLSSADWLKTCRTNRLLSVFVQTPGWSLRPLMSWNTTRALALLKKTSQAAPTQINLGKLLKAWVRPSRLLQGEDETTKPWRMKQRLDRRMNRNSFIKTFAARLSAVEAEVLSPQILQ